MCRCLDPYDPCAACIFFPQDSGVDGAGYETAIKGGALAAGGKPKSRPASKPGTKKVSSNAVCDVCRAWDLWFCRLLTEGGCSTWPSAHQHMLGLFESGTLKEFVSFAHLVQFGVMHCISVAWLLHGCRSRPSKL
jgi:hypothetical protein